MEQNARDLPWRKTADPYAIWVSEIMLQQTRVAVVVDRYQEIHGAFPTLYRWPWRPSSRCWRSGAGWAITGARACCTRPHSLWPSNLSGNLPSQAERAAPIARHWRIYRRGRGQHRA